MGEQLPDEILLPNDPYFLRFDGWVFSRYYKTHIAYFGGCVPSLSIKWKENRKNAFEFIEALERRAIRNNW